MPQVSRHTGLASDRRSSSVTHNSVAVVKPIGIILLTARPTHERVVSSLAAPSSPVEHDLRTLRDDFVGLCLGDALDLAEEFLGRVGDSLEGGVARLGELLAVLERDTVGLRASLQPISACRERSGALLDVDQQTREADDARPGPRRAGAGRDPQRRLQTLAVPANLATWFLVRMRERERRRQTSERGERRVASAQTRRLTSELTSTS